MNDSMSSNFKMFLHCDLKTIFTYYVLNRSQKKTIETILSRWDETSSDVFLSEKPVLEKHKSPHKKCMFFFRY